MKLTSHLTRSFIAAIVAAVICGMTHDTQASGGATDPIPGTSKSGIKSGGTASGGGGGGGGKSSTVTVTPTPAPVVVVPVNPQPLVSAPLTFTAGGSIAGVTPQATGSYHIDNYYPTLSLMTVDLSASSVNEADGSPCYVMINTTGGTFYLFTNNSFSLLNQAGSASVSAYVTPGTVLTSVTVVDLLGNVILTGK